MKIISHRGAAGLALENSLEGIKAGLALPVYAIEVDVRRTADGKLILLHDPHTGYVANKTLIAQHSTLKELRELTLNNGERIPTLDEALKLIGNKVRVMLDLKSHGIADELLRVLRAHPSVDILCSGRQYDEAKALHQANPNYPFLVQHHYDPMEVIHRANRMGARGICLNLWLMNPLTYRLARRHGLEVYVYTLNRPWLLKFFQLLYPDAVIITDHPERFV